jgi:hypothetical protein
VRKSVCETERAREKTPSIAGLPLRFEKVNSSPKYNKCNLLFFLSLSLSQCMLRLDGKIGINNKLLVMSSHEEALETCISGKSGS